MIITLRTAPGHSFKNPTERVNCILNLSLYRMGIMLKNARMPVPSARIWKKTQTMQQPDDVRKLLDQDREVNIKLLKESCDPTITLMKDIFSWLKLKENYLQPCDVAEDDAVSEMFDGIQPDPSLTSKETAQALPKNPLLLAHLKHACREWKYFFPVKKCGIAGCTSCLEPRLLPVFSTLHHLPTL